MLPGEFFNRTVSVHSSLTEEEARIISTQIRRNSRVIEDYVARLDLIINREGHKRHERFVKKIQDRLYLLMEENDTFRKVFWHHYQSEETKHIRTCPLCASSI